MRSAVLALALVAGAVANNIGSHAKKHDIGKVHEVLDEDKDGHLTQDELEGVLRKAYNKERSAKTASILATKQDEIDAAFARMDGNSDGKVTKEEAIPAGSEADNPSTTRRWKLADENDDGTLDKAEGAVFLFPMLSLSAVGRATYFAGEAFANIDSNGDGKVVVDEFKKHFVDEVKKHAADDLESVFMDEDNPKHDGILDEYLKVWFHKADADNSKTISFSEMPSAFAFFEEEPDFKGEAESAIRLADTDKDSKLTKDEIKAAPKHVKDFLAAHGAVHGEL